MKKFNELRIHFHMAIGINNAAQGDEYPLSDFISEHEWNEMSDSEKENFIADCANDWSVNYLDLGGHVE